MHMFRLCREWYSCSGMYSKIDGTPNYFRTHQAFQVLGTVKHDCMIGPLCVPQILREWAAGLQPFAECRILRNRSRRQFSQRKKAISIPSWQAAVGKMIENLWTADTMGTRIVGYGLGCQSCSRRIWQDDHCISCNACAYAAPRS